MAKTKEATDERWSPTQEMTPEEEAARNAAIDAAEEMEAADAEQVEAAKKAEEETAAEQEKAMEARSKEKWVPTSRALRPDESEPAVKPQHDPPKQESAKKS